MRNLAALFLALSFTTVFAPGCAMDTGASVSEEAITQARPTFEVWHATDGWRFQFVSEAGDVLLDSEAYSTRIAALSGVLSVIENGDDVASYTVIPGANGASFSLEAANGEAIADGGQYVSAQEAQAAVDATIDAAIDYAAWRATRTGRRFDVFQGANGQHYFRLRAGNGEIVLGSEGYSSEAAALGGTFSVADFGVSASRYVVRQAANGQWYFNLTASNGQVIGTSELYVSRYNAERGRDAIIALLPTVELL